MAHMSVCLISFLVGVTSSSAHTAATLGVEVARHGQLMRSKDKEGEVRPPAALAEIGDANKKPHYEREAVEAVERPSRSKIDDSYQAPRMPAFIEEYPWFYAMAFVGAAFAFMGVTCMHVQYQDSQDDLKREQMKDATRRRAAASAAMGLPRGEAFATSRSPSAFRGAAEALVSAAARAPVKGQEWDPPFVPAPKARAAAQSRAAELGDKCTKAAEGSMNAITNAVGGFTGMLAGENVKSFASPELSTASGASTPRSHISSDHFSSQNSGSSRSFKPSGISNGTVLLVRMNEVVFASSSSWQEIGELRAGQQVIAAGPPEVADAYTMVPIKPRGAVDLKTLVVQEL